MDLKLDFQVIKGLTLYTPINPINMKQSSQRTNENKRKILLAQNLSNIKFQRSGIATDKIQLHSRSTKQLETYAQLKTKNQSKPKMTPFGESIQTFLSQRGNIPSQINIRRENHEEEARRSLREKAKTPKAKNSFNSKPQGSYKITPVSLNAQALFPFNETSIETHENFEKKLENSYLHFRKTISSFWNKNQTTKSATSKRKHVRCNSAVMKTKLPEANLKQKDGGEQELEKRSSLKLPQKQHFLVSKVTIETKNMPDSNLLNPSNFFSKTNKGSKVIVVSSAKNRGSLKFQENQKGIDNKNKDEDEFLPQDKNSIQELGSLKQYKISKLRGLPSQRKQVIDVVTASNRTKVDEKPISTQNKISRRQTEEFEESGHRRKSTLENMHNSVYLKEMLQSGILKQVSESRQNTKNSQVNSLGEISPETESTIVKTKEPKFLRLKFMKNSKSKSKSQSSSIESSYIKSLETLDQIRPQTKETTEQSVLLIDKRPKTKHTPKHLERSATSYQNAFQDIEHLKLEGWGHECESNFDL